MRRCNTRVRSSNASLVAGQALLSRMAATAAPTSAKANARGGVVVCPPRGKAAVMASPAGLSSRWPSTIAHLMTADTLLRTFMAVGRLWAQIGASTPSTSALVISDTSLGPSVGMA